MSRHSERRPPRAALRTDAPHNVQKGREGERKEEGEGGDWHKDEEARVVPWQREGDWETMRKRKEGKGKGNGRRGS